MTVLTVNSGSSSVRLAAFASGPALTRLADRHYAGADTDPEARLRAFLNEHGVGHVTLVAHRIVHGGTRLVASRRIDAEVEAEIARLAPLAPLHNPVALQWVAACRALFGGSVVQVAVFDTAFYAALPETFVWLWAQTFYRKSCSVPENYSNMPAFAGRTISEQISPNFA